MAEEEMTQPLLQTEEPLSQQNLAYCGSDPENQKTSDDQKQTGSSSSGNDTGYASQPETKECETEYSEDNKAKNAENLDELKLERHDTFSNYPGLPLDRVEEISCFTIPQINPYGSTPEDQSTLRQTVTPVLNTTLPPRTGSVNSPEDPAMRSISALSASSQWTNDTDASGRSVLSDSYSIDSITMRPRRKQRIEPTFESLVSSIRSGSVAINIGLYKRRWYILALYSWFGFMQGGLVDVYTVVAESAEPAFGWSDAETSLMQYWIYACYLIAIFPTCWMIDAKGLRVAVIFGSFFLFLGTLVRCLSVKPPYVTWCANLGNIFVGLAGPTAFTVGPVLSSVWFPPYQRTTATAIATIAGFAGASACFVVGPNIVDAPKAINGSTGNYSNLKIIRRQILYMRYGECLICGLVLLLVLIYFPPKPPKPPSISASLEKVTFGAGIRNLFRKENRRFWLICMTYTFSAGLYDIWSSLYDVNLKHYGVSEKEAGWIAFLAVLIGSCLAIVIGFVSDVLTGKMKLFSVVLVIGLFITSAWLCMVCLFSKVIPYMNVQMYGAALLQGICVNGPVPLFYELAIEASYPISENVTSGMLSVAYNTFPLIFLAIFWIPNTGTAWMNWFYVASAFLCIPLIVLFKERFRRTEVDNLTLVSI